VQDQLNRNPLVVTGTPSLVTGALTVDTNQALQFNGTTNSAAAADSASLSITGSMSIELFLRLTAYPGAPQNVVVKGSSYGVSVDTTGHANFFVVNGAASAAVTSNVVLATSTWHHIVGVYNGNYAGVQQFGKTTLGSTSAQVDDDNGNNKAVSKYTLAEAALLRTVTVSLQYIDELWPVQMRAVVYSDVAGAPGALVTQSPVLTLYPPTPLWRAWTPVSFPLESVVVPAGNYHIGYIADTVAGVFKAPLVVGRETTGGTTSRRPDSVTSPSDPFGTVVSSNADQLAIYLDYSAVGRTGNEGKVLLYINGARNVTGVYSGGIADTANTVQVCPTLAAQVDEISIWNRALSSVQIATHYTAH
jgi:hypothetical protein